MSTPVSRLANVHTLNVLPVYDILFTDKHVVNQLETLMQLIENLIDSRDFDGASTAFTALLCHMKECAGLIFSLGYLLVQRVPRLNTQHSTNNFFNSIFTDKRRHPSTEIRVGWMIFESILYKLRRNDIVAAQFALEDQLRSDKRDRDHIYNALAGMVHFRKYLENNNHSLSSWFHYRLNGGQRLDKAGELMQGIDRLRRALVLEPSNETYAYFLTLMLLESGSENEALETINHFSTSNLNSILGFLMRAKFLRHLNRRELRGHEVSAWQLVLDLDPANDEAFVAILEHFRQKRVTILDMMKTLMARMDVNQAAAENLASWKLLASLLVARKKAIEEDNRARLGSKQLEREVLTSFYAWKQRYWSLESWRLQLEELNTATRVLVVLCSMLVYGPTTYSLNAVSTMAETSTNDMNYHMAPFGGAELLQQHLSLVSRYKELKTGSKKMTNLRNPVKRADKQKNIPFIALQVISGSSAPDSDTPHQDLFGDIPLDHSIPDSEFDITYMEHKPSGRSKKRQLELSQDDLLLNLDALEPSQKMPKLDE